MEDIFYLIVMAVVVICLAGGGLSQQQRADVIEIQRFITYVEKHKDELPDNIKERFEELEEYAEKNQ